MNQVTYSVGLVVIVLIILGYLGLQLSSPALVIGTNNAATVQAGAV